MNIKQAKEQIKNAMRAYFSKDINGEYALPVHQQRPVFLMGPPGVGKTAIMEQVASEMNVALLSYSMTHHTRQSALGLPCIVHKKYSDGTECDVSEYTMSEIISSVFDLMEETGKHEGILFLDEVNCVSETLAPVMLQFLQYKVFGRHRVPDGWIVVTAGNPPEYNDSVREFDIVTWDRLKRIDIEPDYTVWKEYASDAGVHPAVITYLDIRRGDFYSVETSVDGKSFVTARGWEDLSRMIRLYEQNDIKVDYLLIGQYIQNIRIARDFSQYYDLFCKYRSDYQASAILEGKASVEILSRAQRAEFDERLSLISLLLDTLHGTVSVALDTNAVVTELMTILKGSKRQLDSGSKNAASYFAGLLEKKEKELDNGKKASSLSQDDQHMYHQLIAVLREDQKLLQMNSDRNPFDVVKSDFDSRVASMKKQVTQGQLAMSNLYHFAEEAFGEGQEIVIITTELTANKTFSSFLSKFGCREYFSYNKNLLLFERQNEIQKALKELELDL